MNVKFKDVAHLYLGCKIVDSMTGEKYFLHTACMEFSVFNPDGRNISYPILQQEGKAITIRMNEKHKPILRPLSDMTEEERECCDKQGSKGWHIIAKGEPIGTNGSFEKVGLAVFHRQSFEVAYLLSRHFDLFGLIESGEAIAEAGGKSLI